MSSEQELIRHPDGASLASDVGERTIAAIKEAQAQGRDAHISLTGGRGGTSGLEAVLASPDCGSVNWGRVVFWWSDERFLPEGDPQRNETGAREALLDHVAVDPGKVHPMPRLDGPAGDDLDAASASYAAVLKAEAEPGNDIPLFDVCILGVGEDAHVASLFPGRTEMNEPQSVVSVRNSPKPPPLRTTFTLRVILNSRQVWLIASGAGKADAVKLATSGLPAEEAPAGAARGIEKTLFFIDKDAGAKID